ncbi:MAG TPA: Gmad2 immunoglobulin-like domain-containing protein [Gaiellaceae bacterium]|nr:Gmad2 immunoglobulin-like domain-containing protein [Gaiellaceae bacterium]
MPKAALGLVLVVAALSAAACGGRQQAATTTTATTTAEITPIVVESPAEHAVVPHTFVVRGTASVFEATLVVELRRGGAVLERQTVTASEGAPGRGSFKATVHAPSSGDATVVAFAPSAADGSPQHEQTVPVVVR